jgi:O-methyltransferase involved in polyketide biosynthesis
VNHPQTDLPVVPDDPLLTLTADFPQFKIWREETVGGRCHYIARGLHPDTHPHTVVTGDPAELRATLTKQTSQPFDAGTPSIARVYDRWLGGKDNFAADRAVADSLSEEFPEIADLARANRQFVIRAVRHVAAAGITQFIDIGTGLPTSPSIDETVRRLQPAACVAYVDCDPVVLVHARAILAGHRGVVVVSGDMRRPHEILSDPGLRLVIDLSRPVCIMLTSVLHFVTPAEADAIVATFVSAMAPGSYLILSSGTSTGTSPELIARLAAAYQDTTVVSGRSEAEIAAYFTGLELLPPGLVDVWAWRSDAPRSRLATGSARLIGAVGRKPGVRRSDPPIQGTDRA